MKNSARILTISALLFSFCMIQESALANLGEAQRLFLGKERKGAQDYAQIAGRLMESKIYFAAIPFIKEALYLTPKQDNYIDRTLERVIDAVGSIQFKQLPIEMLMKSKSAHISYIVAYYYFKKKQYQEALKYVRGFPSGHKRYPNVLFLRGAIYDHLDKYNESIKSFKRCTIAAQKLRDDFDKQQAEFKSYQFIFDSCNIGIGRVLFKAGEFKRSTKYYNYIPKTSYKWPSILLEDAWNAYKLEDYNRAIGRLLTFQAPILDNYFFPEAEVLKAMSYVEMCLWNDAIEVIKRYQKVYAPNGERLIQLLQRPNLHKHFFIKIAMNTTHRDLKDFQFLNDLVGAIRNAPYYVNNFDYLKKLTREYKRLKNIRKQYRSSKKRTLFITTLLYNLRESKKDQVVLLNQHVKRYLYFIANQVVRTNEDLLEIHLEAFSRKKEQIYETKAAKIGDRSRGDLTAVERDVKQYFWKFKSEFWADELGDYVLALKSECKEGDK